MGLLQTTTPITKPADASITAISSLEELPVPIYQFSIEFVHDKPVALFQTVSGLAITRAVEPLNEGGLNNFGREFPGQIGYGHVTFGVGLCSSDFFYKWMMDGQYAGRAAAKNFSLFQRRHNPQPAASPVFPVIKRWDFFNGFPVSWKLSELTIKDSTNIVIETLEISFDYFQLAAP